MLVQRCSLDQHRLIIPVSITKPILQSDIFSGNFNHHHYRALVDTGAQRTVLSRSVIEEQKLLRIGHMQFAGLHGPKTHSRYLASLAFWVKRIDSNQSFNDAEQSLYTLEEPFEVVDMENNANFDLILGFDVMKAFSFDFDTRYQMFQIIVRP